MYVSMNRIRIHCVIIANAQPPSGPEIPHPYMLFCVLSSQVLSISAFIPPLNTRPSDCYNDSSSQYY